MIRPEIKEHVENVNVSIKALLELMEGSSDKEIDFVLVEFQELENEVKKLSDKIYAEVMTLIGGRKRSNGDDCEMQHG